MEIIDISTVTADPTQQIRDQTNPKIVKRFKSDIELGAVLPPIIVYEENKQFYVIDGFHRLAAFKEMGHKTIKVTIAKDVIDRRAHAIALNSKSHCLTNKEKRRLADEYIQKFPEKNSRQIASMIGLSHTYIDSRTKENTSNTPIVQPPKVEQQRQLPRLRIHALHNERSAYNDQEEALIADKEYVYLALQVPKEVWAFAKNEIRKSFSLALANLPSRQVPTPETSKDEVIS